jgi:hypothetical protein
VISAGHFCAEALKQLHETHLSTSLASTPRASTQPILTQQVERLEGHNLGLGRILLLGFVGFLGLEDGFVALFAEPIALNRQRMNILHSLRYIALL